MWFFIYVYKVLCTSAYRLCGAQSARVVGIRRRGHTVAVPDLLPTTVVGIGLFYYRTIGVSPYALAEIYLNLSGFRSFAFS